MDCIEVFPLLQQDVSESLATDQYLLNATQKSNHSRNPVLRCYSLPRPTLLFGQYQRIPQVFLDQVVLNGQDGKGDGALQRRHTGGRLMPGGDGFLHLSLIMPSSVELAPASFPKPLPPEKIMNRYVRGILKGLNILGARSFYAGRDFITARSKKIGWVSFEVDEAGAVLFECILAWRQSFAALASWIAGYGLDVGERHDLLAEDECGTVEEMIDRSIEIDELAGVLTQTYASHYTLDARQREFNHLEQSYMEVLRNGQFDERSWLTSRSIDEQFSYQAATPIQLGMFEVAVELQQHRFLKEVKLSGDFIASSPAISALEQDLRLCPLDWRAIGGITDRILNHSHHFILGLGTRRVIPDTILRAISESGAWVNRSEAKE